MTIPTAAAAAIPSAVDALLKWKTSESNSNKPQLLPQDDFIYLVLTLKKIPQKPRTNPYKIPLPNPLIPPNSFSEICLIIDDRPNSNLTSSIAKQKIQTDEITAVTKVIKFSKLKTDYKPFESKRKLCDSYDLFFADKRVIPLLPKLLGKTFFHKKKLPLGLDLTHNIWKDQIHRACSSGLLFFSTGTCCVVRVAKVSMERDEIVDNVTAALNGAVGFVPKKLAGVRSLHLKFSDSVALPLYQSLPDVKLRILGKKDEVVEGVDEVMEIVEVGKKSKSKKRIHEVNHHDDGEVENEDSISVEEDVGKSSKKKRKAGGLCVPNVVTELPTPLFKKQKLRDNYSAAGSVSQDSEKNRRPVFGKRTDKKKFNRPVKVPTTVTKENFKTIGKNQANYGNVNNSSVYERSSSIMTKIRRNGGNVDHSFTYTGSSSATKKMNNPASKWQDFIDVDDDTDGSLLESGFQEINHAGFETKVLELEDAHDVGSDDTDSVDQSPMPRHLVFEDQRKQIIMLWHLCHVSIIHRTQFYMLFRGDPADEIYVEVELRRLTWLEQQLAELGNASPALLGDEPAGSVAASIKALRQEREYLAKRVSTKLSAEEREMLYRKWDIPVEGKQRRRLQLVNRLWTDPLNMAHIKESAEIVAKLVGFCESGEHASKEMFALNFVNPSDKKAWMGWNLISNLLHL